MTDRPLAGRVALVTGANHGIGAATSLALARLGADVAVSFLRLAPAGGAGPPLSTYDRQRAGDAGDVVAGVRAAGSRGVALEADLADPATPARLLDEAGTVLGPVDIVVHNASGWRQDSFAPARGDPFDRPVGLVSAASVDAQFAVDAKAGALLIAEFAERLRRRAGSWGRLVTLTSGGDRGFPGEVSYGAAKAALENYTMSASIELAGLGVTANVVHPPVTDTGWVTDEVRRFVETSTDHVHVAQPGEVGEVIAWLCTDAARLVTGNVLRLR